MANINVPHNPTLYVPGNTNGGSCSIGSQKTAQLVQLLADNPKQSVNVDAVSPALPTILEVPTNVLGDGKTYIDSLPLYFACKIVDAWLINGAGAGSSADDKVKLSTVALDGTATDLSAGQTVNGVAANGFSQYLGFDPAATTLEAGCKVRAAAEFDGTFTGGTFFVAVVPVDL